MPTPSATQELSSEGISADEIKHELLDRKMSVSALARKLKRPRSTVSTAIHKHRFPLLRAKIVKVLRRG